jgi:hypothetical protein
MVDAYRLKRNFGYWLMSYHDEPFEIIQNKSKAIVEHHSNNHVHCDDWCSMKQVDALKTATGNLKYRCCKVKSTRLCTSKSLMSWIASYKRRS